MAFSIEVDLFKMELDFSTDDIGKMLLKKASLDKKWMNILVGTFDKRFFKNIPGLDIIATLQVKFYEKYEQAPSSKALSGMAKAYLAKYPNSTVSLADLNKLINDINAIDFQVPDDAINNNLKERTLVT